MAYAEPEAPSLEEVESPSAEVDRHSRTEAAVALLIAGAPYSEIARTLGYSSAHSARSAVEQSLAATVGPEDRARERFLCNRRLNRLLQSVWTKADNPDHEEHLAAVRSALALIDRQIRLGGLDAPSEITVHSPHTAEIELWVRKMASRFTAALPDEVDVIEAEEVED